MRLFVAVPLPPDVAAAAAGAIPELPGLRRVSPEHLHVTLAFIGDVAPERLDEVAASVREAVAGTAPFEVAIDALGRFPEAGAPRIVWLGIGRGAAELTALAARVRRSLAARGVDFDAKPFRAHVTLARVRETADRDTVRALAGIVARARAPRLGFRADGVVLFESALSPKGPRYTSRAAVPLEAGGGS